MRRIIDRIRNYIGMSRWQLEHAGFRYWVADQLTILATKIDPTDEWVVVRNRTGAAAMFQCNAHGYNIVATVRTLDAGDPTDVRASKFYQPDTWLERHTFRTSEAASDWAHEHHRPPT